jgi:8-oxo-dGTP pyrophosphatase MutT (NUDIX family)
MKDKLRKILNAQGLRAPTYAIVLPLVWNLEGPELLIEVRASGISQAGDPCFPGGRIEPGEAPAEAALRELGEELDIHIGKERLLGQLPTVQTYLGSKTDAFVCTVTPEEAAAVCANPAEVSVLLRVPLSFFQKCPTASSYQVEGHTIWGMTAGAIHHLIQAWDRAAQLPSV